MQVSLRSEMIGYFVGSLCELPLKVNVLSHG